MTISPTRFMSLSSNPTSTRIVLSATVEVRGSATSVSGASSCLLSSTFVGLPGNCDGLPIVDKFVATGGGEIVLRFDLGAAARRVDWLETVADGSTSSMPPAVRNRSSFAIRA